MHALLLLSFLSQAPLVTTTPPLGSPQWVQRQLMATDWLLPYGPVIRVESRVLRLQDEDFAQSFALVPEAQSLATSARASYETGSRWLTASTAMLAGGAVLMVTGAFVPLISTGPGSQSLAPTLLISGSGLVCMVSGLFLSLLSFPALQRATNDFFGAIATYNRGLLDVRPPVIVEP